MMSEIESWNELVEPPHFLVQIKSFGLISIFDDQKKKLTSGWILIHNRPNFLRLENLGNISRVSSEFQSIQNFIEFYFAREIREDFNFRIMNDKTYLDIYCEKKLQNRVLLQLTKPNADICKYTLDEFMKFRGYWNVQNSDVTDEPFELKFRYSSAGYQIILKQDYHSWHAYGEIIPEDKSIPPWLTKIFKHFRIDYKEIDSCTYSIKSLSAFLELCNLCRSKSEISWI